MGPYKKCGERRAEEGPGMLLRGKIWREKFFEFDNREDNSDGDKKKTKKKTITGMVGSESQAGGD